MPGVRVTPGAPLSVDRFNATLEAAILQTKRNLAEGALDEPSLAFVVPAAPTVWSDSERTGETTPQHLPRGYRVRVE